MSKNTGIKSPLGRARGLGSAGVGVESWIRLRVAAIASVFLSVWFLWFIRQSVGLAHEEFITLLAHPMNAIAMILLVIGVFFHASLGCREIVEDYIHHEGFKLFKLVGIYLFFFAAGLACIFSVLKIAL